MNLPAILLRARQHGFSLGAVQLAAALHACEAGRMTARDASREIGVSDAAITGIIDALEAKGFARRQVGTDRRVKWLHLTEAGSAFLTLP